MAGQRAAVLDSSACALPAHKRLVRDFAARFFQRKKGAQGPVHLFFEETHAARRSATTAS